MAGLFALAIVPADGTEPELERLRTQITEQAALIEQLRQRVVELEARLNKDSHNSNKPPSSDSPFKKPPPRSQRKPSGRKPGGKKGHPGSTLELIEEPDGHTIVPLTSVCDRGRCRGEIGSLPKSSPSAARSSRGRDPAPGGRTAHGRRYLCLCLPAHTPKRLSYSRPCSRAVRCKRLGLGSLSLTQCQSLPYQHTAELFEQLAGIALSAGTLYRAVEVAIHRLKPSVQAIREALIDAPVAHADETGMRVGTDPH